MAIRVRATQPGFHKYFREAGHEFHIPDESHFSKRWMKKIDEDGDVQDEAETSESETPRKLSKKEMKKLKKQGQQEQGQQEGSDESGPSEEPSSSGDTDVL